MFRLDPGSNLYVTTTTQVRCRLFNRLVHELALLYYAVCSQDKILRTIVNNYLAVLAKSKETDYSRNSLKGVQKLLSICYPLTFLQMEQNLHSASKLFAENIPKRSP